MVIPLDAMIEILYQPFPIDVAVPPADGVNVFPENVALTRLVKVVVFLNNNVAPRLVHVPA